MNEKDYSQFEMDHPAGLLWDKMVDEVHDYAFILLDKNGTILNWNKGAETIKGYTREEVIGQHFRIFYTTEDQQSGLPEKLITRAVAESKVLHEGWRIRKDGTRFWGSIVITALHEGDEIVGFLKITRDLTYKKNAEDLLKEKNRALEKMNQELTSFAYVASHDLQEPLRKIQTFASRIIEAEKGNFSERSIEYFTRMQGAANRMQTLIQDLLTYSRTTSGENKFELVDLNALLELVKNDLETLIQEKKGVIVAARLPVIMGVKFQCQQLLLNLIGNALKFSKVDTPARVEIQHHIVKGIDIAKHNADPGKNYHHLAFLDNGIGFESEYNEKIFEVFQRLHGKAEYSGTGIGLSICKKIVENHGGFIDASGVLDMGATFNVYIPEK
jgi:PAS domain S-box-containing protein